MFHPVGIGGEILKEIEPVPAWIHCCCGFRFCAEIHSGGKRAQRRQSGNSFQHTPTIDGWVLPQRHWFVFHAEFLSDQFLRPIPKMVVDYLRSRTSRSTVS